MAEVGGRRAGELLRGVFHILAAAPGGLPSKQVLSQLEVSVPPTPYELLQYKSDPRRRRYEIVVQFYTISVVKSGWMIKTDGVWQLTDSGRAAYEAFPDPEDFQRESAKGYALWKKAQPGVTSSAVDSEPKLGPRSWLFQANPTLYNIAGAVAALPRLTWFVKRYANEIEVGDTVFVWQTGASSSFIAVGHVSAEAEDTTLLPGEEKYAVHPDVFEGLSLRAVVDLDYRVSPPIARSEVLAVPGLQELPHFAFSQGSNYRLTGGQAGTLLEAIKSRLVAVAPPVSAADPDSPVPPVAWRSELFDAAAAANRAAPWTNATLHDLACKQLRTWLDERSSYTDEEFWSGIKEHYLPFGSATLDGAPLVVGQAIPMTQEVFEQAAADGRVVVRGNWQWTSLARGAGRAQGDIPALRTGVDLLLDASVPPAERIRELMTGSAHVKGWGRAIWTGLLAMADGWQTPAVNEVVLEAFKRLGWPLLEWDIGTLLEQVLARSSFLLQQGKLASLADLDRVYWYVTNQEGDAQPDPEPVVEVVAPPMPRPTIAELGTDLCLAPGYLEDVEWLLRDRKQIVFYGPPGTGKTFVAERFAQWFTESPDRTKTIQFHASFAYEDFIEGIRPDLAEGGLGYELKPGILRSFAEQARSDPQHKPHVLVIDEINRANLSRVFGELLFLLEYRKASIELPYSRDSFSLPDNLYIIGTMNTADRSIALVDFALRRRFHFVEFAADASILRRWLAAKNPAMVGVSDLLDWVNATIGDHDFAVGFSYFMRDDLDEAILDRIWRRSILPALHEFYFDDATKPNDFSLANARKAIAPNTEALLAAVVGELIEAAADGAADVPGDEPDQSLT